MARTDDSLFDARLEVSTAVRRRLRPHLSIRNFLVLFAILFFLIAWNRGVALIYVMSALMTGVLLVSYIAPYLSMRGVVASRDQYFIAAAGEVVDIALTLQRKGPGWCRMLEAIDNVPCAAAGSRRPMVYVPKLHGTTQASYQVEMDWRGLHTLGPLELYSGFPLGVHRVKRLVSNSCARVLVYPTPFKIARIRFDRAGAAMTLGPYLSSHKGGYDEFSALREYRLGDSIRHIHWAKSSQGRELQVKEYESYENNAVSIVLDRTAAANLGEGRLSTFEYQTRIAIAVARYCIDNGIHVGLFDGTEQALAPACNEAHYRRIRESLALVQADRADDRRLYADYVQALMDKSPPGCWVLFSNDDSSGLSALNYHRFISQVSVVAFNSNSFQSGSVSGTGSGSSAGSAYYISRDDDLESVFSL